MESDVMDDNAHAVTHLPRVSLWRHITYQDHPKTTGNQDSSVDAETMLTVWTNRGSNLGSGKSPFASTKCPD